MAVQTTRTVEELEAYCARLRAAGLDAPWSRPGPLIPPKPTATQARHWRWRDIEPLLFESSEYLGPRRGAERRVLRLHNPGVPERTVAHSLVLAIQYLLPGEVAPAHRHSPTAIRFMLHGEGAFTTVDGQKCAMKSGDLVLTPGMAWHDHGNAASASVYWMDILDVQIVRVLENLTFEPYPDEQQPALRSPGRDIYFPWTDAYAALLRRAEQAPDPFDDVLLEYVDPTTGGSLRPTVACYLQLLRPAIRTRAHRAKLNALGPLVGRAAGKGGMSRYRVGKRPDLNRMLGSRDRVPPADAVTRGLKDGGTPWDVRWQGPPFPDDRVNFDSHARVKDMDIEGVDVNMVLPSGGLAAFSGLDDVAVEQAMYQAYHRFLQDYCAPYPDRLTSVLHVSVRDVAASVAEIRRCGKERWPVGIFPICPPGMTLDDPDWEPIWAAAQEHDLTVVIHSFTMSIPYPPGMWDNWDNMFLVRSASHVWNAQRNMAALIGSGVLDRFRRLRLTSRR